MRLKTRAEKQAERGMATLPKFSRQFARHQWRKHCGDMFMFRKKIGPSFAVFIKGLKNAPVQSPVQAV